MNSANVLNSAKKLSYIQNGITLYKTKENNYFTVDDSGKVVSYPKEKGIIADNFIKTSQQEIKKKSLIAGSLGLVLSLFGLHKFAPKMSIFKKSLISSTITITSFLAGVFIPLNKNLKSAEWIDICNTAINNK